MKAWQLNKIGAENVRLVEQPKPEPGPGQILVRPQAASLNYRDRAIIDGTYPAPVPFPLTLGSEVAGEVVAVGSEVSEFQPGDKVLSVFHQGWLDG